MKLSQVFGWAFVTFIVLNLILNPVGMGHIAHNVIDGFRSAVATLPSFFGSL